MVLMTRVKIAIFVLSVVNAIWYFLPYAWNYIYTRSELEALAWNGFGAILGPAILLEIYMVVNVLAHFYLITLNAKSRVVFAVTILFGPLITLCSGMVVQTASEAFVGYLLSLFDGALLGFLVAVSRSGNRLVESIQANIR